MRGLRLLKSKHIWCFFLTLSCSSKNTTYKDDIIFQEYACESLNIDLFDIELKTPLKYVVGDSLFLFIDSVRSDKASIVSSSFILVLASDTIYDLGMVNSKLHGYGHAGRCPNSTRYYFSDTTFQNGNGEFCASLLTDNDYGVGVCLDKIDEINNYVKIPLFAKLNNKGIRFINLFFDSTTKTLNSVTLEK